jgi:hypothetical protein
MVEYLLPVGKDVRPPASVETHCSFVTTDVPITFSAGARLQTAEWLWPARQGINLAGHGDADGKLAAPDGTHPHVLRAQDQRTGEPQIDLGIAPPGCGRGYKNLEVALAQPLQHLWRRGDGDGDRAEGALTGTDDIRIPDVRLALTDDEAGDASGIGGAQDSPQIAGFLEPFRDHVEPQTPRRESGQLRPGLGGNAQDTIGVVAIANFVKDCRADLLEGDPHNTSALQEVGISVCDLRVPWPGALAGMDIERERACPARAMPQHPRREHPPADVAGVLRGVRSRGCYDKIADTVE